MLIQIVKELNTKNEWIERKEMENLWFCIGSKQQQQQKKNTTINVEQLNIEHSHNHFVVKLKW